jgi:hypothetical protein
MHYGFAGGENMLGHAPGTGKKTELGEWRAYGGHRLWTAPELVPDTYAPDNDPVAHESPGPLSLLVKSRANGAGVGREIRITLDPEGTRVQLHHRITNAMAHSIRVAPWALTIMRGGGVAIIPQEPYASHEDSLLPARAMALWGYTNLSDPRWHFDTRFLSLASVPAMSNPQKAGVLNKQGWCAYHHGTTLFVKTIAFEPDGLYPDYNCNNEVFTAGDFIEIESLGPLVDLEPGAGTDHSEAWTLTAGVPRLEPGASEKQSPVKLSDLLGVNLGAPVVR